MINVKLSSYSVTQLCFWCSTSIEGLVQRWKYRYSNSPHFRCSGVWTKLYPCNNSVVINCMNNQMIIARWPETNRSEALVWLHWKNKQTKWLIIPQVIPTLVSHNMSLVMCSFTVSTHLQQVPAVPMMYAPQMYGGVQTVMMPAGVPAYQYPPMAAPVGAPVGGKLIVRLPHFVCGKSAECFTFWIFWLIW